MITRIKYTRKESGELITTEFVINSKLSVVASIIPPGFIVIRLSHHNPPTRQIRFEYLEFETKNLNCAKYRVRKELEKLGMSFNNEVRQKRGKRK
jgi:hypothetical protein